MPAMRLERKLGFWGVFCIAGGAMISSGLFVLPALAYAQAGPAVVLAYALAAVLVIPAMLAKAELATAMPRSGGSYFFIERSMGALPGTLAGLANWLSIALKSSFALIGIGVFAELVFVQFGWGPPGEITIKAIAIGFCVLFGVLNLLSVKATGRLQILLVAVLLGVLAFYIIAGMPATRHDSFKGFMDKGPWAVLGTAGLVFVSFGGLTKVASVAEEVRRPGRNIPGGMILAVVVVSVVYVAAVFVTVGVMGESGLRAGDRMPLSSAAGMFAGRAGVILLAVAAVLAFFTTANGGILAASRSPLAMSRDRLLPGVLGRISGRLGTPYVSILATIGFMIIVIAALSIENLVKFASTMMLMLFVLINIAVLIMRGSRIQNYRPLFRAPGYPWVQLAGVAIYVFLIVEMGATMHWVPLLITGAFVAGGVLWYAIYVRPRIVRESALVYMVKRAVSRDIRRSGLEEELKQIALERDQIVHDRFDHLISRCEILDIPGPISSDDMFRRIAEALAPRLGMDPAALLEKFRQREQESSTVIQPGLAIPHVVVDGERLFDVALVRCQAGVAFPGHEDPVRTVFVLVGSADERNYHLRALMAIASIVQERAFARRWLSAPEAEHLRDLVLLSGRTRDRPAQ